MFPEWFYFFWNNRNCMEDFIGNMICPIICLSPNSGQNLPWCSSLKSNSCCYNISCSDWGDNYPSEILSWNQIKASLQSHTLWWRLLCFVKSGFMTFSFWLQDSLPSTQAKGEEKIFCLDDFCIICFLNFSDKWLMNVQATVNEMHISSPRIKVTKCFSKLIKVSRYFSTFLIFWKNSWCPQATYPSLFLWDFMSLLKSMSALTVFWGCVFYFSCSCSQSGMIRNLQEFVYDSIFSSLEFTKLPCPLNLKVLDEWTLHPQWFQPHWLPCTLSVQSFVLLLENKTPRLQVFSHTFLPASLFTQGLLVMLSLEFRSCWVCSLS